MYLTLQTRRHDIRNANATGVDVIDAWIVLRQSQKIACVIAQFGRRPAPSRRRPAAAVTDWRRSRPHSSFLPGRELPSSKTPLPHLLVVDGGPERGGSAAGRHRRSAGVGQAGSGVGGGGDVDGGRLLRPPDRMAAWIALE